ncbi:MAG: zf-HC2 domain-containing protein [Thermodesulfobacteriota bacterium]
MKDLCSSVSKLLEKYFDQEVTQKERSLVEKHLLGCPTCRDTLKSMEGLRDMIKVPVEEAVRKEDFQWVWQNIQREIRLRERPTVWETVRSWLDISPLFQRRIWVPIAASMVLIILISTPLLFKKTPSFPGPYVVEYVESQTHNVMIYQSEKSKVTVIWLLEGPEKEVSPS